VAYTCQKLKIATCQKLTELKKNWRKGPINGNVQNIKD
jgi:hypothetical protein